jgi:hypothetical protein
VVFSAGTVLTAALLNAAFDSLLTAEGGYASVATAQTTASLTYVDLATVGPQVSVTSVGTRALILFGARLRNASAAAGTGCTVAITGATTLAAADANGAMWTDFVNAGYDDEKMQFMFVTINPGLNTYTMKYRASAGTAQYSVRRMYVFAP